jgi:alpha-glucoside transport system permease protein
VELPTVRNQGDFVDLIIALGALLLGLVLLALVGVLGRRLVQVAPQWWADERRPRRSVVAQVVGAGVALVLLVTTAAGLLYAGVGLSQDAVPKTLWDVVSSLVIVVIALTALLAFLAVVYGLTRFVPGRWQEGVRSWVFLFPAMLAMAVGLLVPAVRTIYLSLLDDNRQEFIGLDNYVEIFQNTNTRLTVYNSLVWVVFGTVGAVVVGLVIARFADGIRGEQAAKSAIFLPQAISLVGAGIIWGFVYAGPPFNNGLLNRITGAIPGLPDSMGGNGERLWLLERGVGGLDPPASAPGFNTFLLIVIFVWASAGFATVVFSAAIKGVPDSLLEAAKVDGATDRQVFYKVMLPYIRATIVTVATTTTIAGLKVFDIVNATTGGRFGTSTIANEFYVTKFVQSRDGLGAALAVLIFVLVIPVVVLNRRAQQRAEEMMGA